MRIAPSRSERSTVIRVYRGIVLLLLLGASACGPNESASAPGALAPAGAAVDSITVACPSTDFPAFLAAFAEDPVLQRAWTRFPLEQLVVVDSVPEPTPVERSVTREQATFPLLPNAEQRSADSLELRIEEAEAGRKHVVIEKPDTDWVVTYIFAHDGCWRLIRIEDWSL